jgi:V/A-type H+/Na+-transporting ATPase subunit I
MIVAMKKVSLVLLESERDGAVRQLGELGVVHLEPMKGSGERLETLEERRAQAARAKGLITALAPPSRPASGSPLLSSAEARSAVSQILAVNEKVERLSEERSGLKRDAEQLAPWGDYEPQDIRELREKGVDLRLYLLSLERYRELSREHELFVHFRSKTGIGCSAAERHERFRESEEVPLPALGLCAVKSRIAEIDREIASRAAELSRLSDGRRSIDVLLAELDEQIEAEAVRTGMGAEESLAYLTGYVPESRVTNLQERAASAGWGILIRDPDPDDAPPTLIENPRWIRFIQPMFNLLGLVPGYREFDISPWFLIFFSVFFALLIGDAAYGLIFLAGTIFFRIRMPNARKEYFSMMYVFSVCTIIWGAMTGTWFGSLALSQTPLLSKLIVPQLYSYNAANNPFIMYICFTIALAHLTIAHLMNFFKKLPSLPAFEDLGQLLIVWGLYFLVVFLVVGRPLMPATVWLVVGGLAVRIVFASQRGRFGKGILSGFAKLPLMLLNSVSTFSDIVSYVRLFAVGLATVAVAQSFNGMAFAVGNSVPGYLAMALILLLGHGLNITLGALALIVHGVRLNLLEFSGHLEMEWTGTSYRPFALSKETLGSNKD